MIIVIVFIKLFMDTEPIEKSEYLVLLLWSFSFIPSYMFVYYWLRTKSFQEGVRIGNFFGRGFGLVSFIIPLLIAPSLMILYYGFLFQGKFNEF